MITSAHNPKIQWVKQLQSRSKERREAGAFVVEGVRLVEEAMQSGWDTWLVLHIPELGPRSQAVVDGFAERGANIETASPLFIQDARATENPQGLLAVMEIRSLPVPSSPDLILIPDGVRDPGNLGSMLRTAAAARVSLVCLPEGTVDVFAPKVVRSAMGAHFRLPLLSASWDEIGNLLERSEVRLYLAAAEEGIPYTQANLRQPLAMIIGGEAAGAGDPARNIPHQIVHIPMPGKMESLNAAAATAVLLFEVVRQRSQQ